MGRAVIIAGALIAGAILVRTAWTQPTTIPLTLGYVVAACGTPPTLNAATGWSYTNNSVAPITIDITGKLCTSM
jgi:hypothetical protein